MSVQRYWSPGGMNESESGKYVDYYDYEALKKRLDEYIKADKEVTASYLRIREIVGAWNTNWGGENRFEVTEAAIASLKKREATMIEALKQIDDLTDSDTISFIAKAALNAEKG